MASNMIRALVVCTLTATICNSGFAAPVYRLRTALKDPNGVIQYQLRGFNNQGYVTGNKLGIDGECFLFKDGVYAAANSQALEPGSTCTIFGVADADAQGNIRAVGQIVYPDSYAPDGLPIRSRAFLMTLSSNGVPAATALPNYIFPDDGSLRANKEAYEGYAYGVNSSGTMVGWPAQTWSAAGGNGTFVGNAAEFPGVDNQGNILATAVDFYHGTLQEYYGERIGNSPVGGLPDQPNGANTYVSQICGGFLTGYVYTGTNDIPVVGTYGSAHVQQLPGLPGYTSPDLHGLSVNASGDVVGAGRFDDHGSFFRAYVLWKNRGDHYDVYDLRNLLVNPILYSDVDTIYINDAGQIAVGEGLYPGQAIYILEPTGGKITVETPSVFAENSGAAIMTLKLQRGDNYTGPVSVQYTTTNDTALAGVRYTAVSGTVSWAAGDSSDKVISVPLIDNNVGDQYETFQVLLQNPSGAGLATTNLYCTISDDGGNFTFSAENYKIMDNWTNVVIAIDRKDGADGAASLYYYTYDLSAVAGTDYVATNGALTWAAGDASRKTITVPIISRGTGFTNVDFGISGYISSADSSGAMVVAPYAPDVTIVRPGHPVPAAVTQFAQTNATTLQMNLDATVGGTFVIQSSTNLTDPNAWHDFLTLTNVTGVVNLNDLVLTVKGKFYRVISK